jgi:hypothetical protein
MAVASWVIAPAAMTLLGLVIWSVWTVTQANPFDALSKPLQIVLGVCGLYAGVGSVCLYLTMWIYWLGVERTKLPIRLSWFVLLICGLHYGALIYAYVVWKYKLERATAPYSTP